MELSLDQRNILDEFTTLFRNNLNHTDVLQKMALLDGFSGSGKSTLTARIAKLLAQSYSVKVTAPTHKAVEVVTNMLNKKIEKIVNPDIETSTIHSHLRLKIKNNYDNGKVSLFPDNFAEPVGYVDLLIVDEYSMIDETLYTFIYEKLNQGHIGFVLFVGDSLQLPPVNDDFSVLNVVNPENVFKLTKVIRQAEGNPIIQAAQTLVTAIKHNTPYATILKELKLLGQRLNSPHIVFTSDINDFTEQAILSNDQIVLSYTNRNVDLRNELIRHFVRESDIVDGHLQEYLPDDLLVLQSQYKLDGVTFRNNQQIKVINAVKKSDEHFTYWDCNTSDGVVHIISKESKPTLEAVLKKIKLLANNESDSVKRGDLWRKFFRINERFCDVKYSYAGTIHKAQGSTYKNVFIDLTDFYVTPQNNSLMLRLVYVAITRSSENVTILSL